MNAIKVSSLRITRIAKWFVILWTVYCLLGMLIGSISWYSFSDSKPSEVWGIISDAKWITFTASLHLWIQTWGLPVIAAVCIDHLFKDQTPLWGLRKKNASD